MDIDKKVLPLVELLNKAGSESLEQLPVELSRILKKHENEPDLINKLGVILYRSSNYGLAASCFENVVKNHPNYFLAYNNLGLVFNRFGLGRQAAEAYKKVLQVKPDYYPSLSNLALVLHYFGETGRDEILQAQKDVATYAFSNSKNYLQNKKTDLDKNRRLRVGYVSGDLRDHAVGHFVQGILKHQNRDKFELHVFDSYESDNDPVTAELSQLNLKWHGIKGLDTQAACEKVINENIDVLFDLGGYTRGGRTDIFSNRVAPVQVNYLGYPNTSGMSTMDFRLGDSYADLVEFENQNTEQMIRLPHAMWNYQPWSTMANVSKDSACKKNGYVTFGSANNQAKIQPEWLRQWARVLERVPDSRLILKSQGLSSNDIVNNILKIFAERGIDKQRIEFRHYSPNREQHWKEISDFDIALDSFPYNGTTTTCDLLWLGVPVITRSGNSHVSRTTGSILNTLGLGDWIAYSDDEFVELCVKKAADMESLAELHQSLKNRMTNSTLINVESFMPAFESALTEMWHIHCDKEVAK